MAHKHGFWFRLRMRVSYWFMPPCHREMVDHLLEDYAARARVAELAEALENGDTAAEDQVTAILRDMGANVEIIRLGGDDA